MILRSAISDLSHSNGCFVCSHHVSSVRCRTDGLHTGVFTTYVSAWGDNVAVEFAADFNAIFHDCSLGANLHTTIFDHFDAVNNFNFF